MQSIVLDINIKKSNSKKSQAKPNLLGPHPHPQSLEVSSKVISGWFQLGLKSFKPQQLIFRKNLSPWCLGWFWDGGGSQIVPISDSSKKNLILCCLGWWAKPNQTIHAWEARQQAP